MSSSNANLSRAEGVDWIACKWNFQFITKIFYVPLYIVGKYFFQGCLPFLPFTVSQAICDTDICRPSAGAALRKHSGVALSDYKVQNDKNKCLFVPRKKKKKKKV